MTQGSSIFAHIFKWLKNFITRGNHMKFKFTYAQSMTVFTLQQNSLWVIDLRSTKSKIILRSFTEEVYNPFRIYINIILSQTITNLLSISSHLSHSRN